MCHLEVANWPTIQCSWESSNNSKLMKMIARIWWRYPIIASSDQISPPIESSLSLPRSFADFLRGEFEKDQCGRVAHRERSGGDICGCGWCLNCLVCTWDSACNKKTTIACRDMWMFISNYRSFMFMRNMLDTLIRFLVPFLYLGVMFVCFHFSSMSNVGLKIFGPVTPWPRDNFSSPKTAGSGCCREVSGASRAPSPPDGTDVMDFWWFLPPQNDGHFETATPHESRDWKIPQNSMNKDSCGLKRSFCVGRDGPMIFLMSDSISWCAIFFGICAGLDGHHVRRHFHFVGFVLERWGWFFVWFLVFGTIFLFWGRILLQWFAFIWTILYCSQCIHAHVLWQCDHHVVIRTLQRSLGDEETPHQQTNIDLSIYFSDDSNLTLHRRPCVEIHGFAAFAGLLSLHCCGRDWGQLQHAAASTSIREQWEIQQWRCSGGAWLHCRRGEVMQTWWNKRVQFRDVSWGMRMCFRSQGEQLLLLLHSSATTTRWSAVQALHKKQLLHDNSSSQRSRPPRTCGWRSTHPNLGWGALPLAEAGHLLSVALLRV